MPYFHYLDPTNPIEYSPANENDTDATIGKPIHILFNGTDHYDLLIITTNDECESKNKSIKDLNDNEKLDSSNEYEDNESSENENSDDYENSSSNDKKSIISILSGVDFSKHEIQRNIKSNKIQIRRLLNNLMDKTNVWREKVTILLILMHFYRMDMNNYRS